MDSCKRAPIDVNYHSLETRGQMQLDRDHNENVQQSISSNIDSYSRNSVPDESPCEITAKLVNAHCMTPRIGIIHVLLCFMNL